MESFSKHQLLHSEALRLIYERGFKGSTMRDLAERLNCDVANIYNYIESKQHLLESYLFELSMAFHEGVDQIIASRHDAKEKVRKLVQLYVQMSYQKPYQMSLLVNEWRHLEPSRRSEFLAERKAYEGKVFRMMSLGIRKGQLRKMDPEIATHLVLAATRWLFTYFTADRATVNPVELEREITDFVLHGIGV